MFDQIPCHWNKVKFGDIANFRRGTTYVASDIVNKKEKYPLFITMKSFRVGGGYSEDGDKYFCSEYTRNQIVEQNELLFANTDLTPTCEILGCPLLVPQSLTNVLFSHHVSAVNFEMGFDKTYLYYLFCLPRVRKIVSSFGRGTTVKMLDLSDLAKLVLSTPPLTNKER